MQGQERGAQGEEERRRDEGTGERAKEVARALVGKATGARVIWLGWPCLTEEATPIDTAFAICFSRRKNGLLNRLPSTVRI